MLEAESSLGQAELAALLLKSHNGGQLTKVERQALRKVCHYCVIGRMVSDEYNIGLVCDNCGRCPDHIQC